MVKRAQFSVKTPQINFIYTFKGVISLPHIITPAKGHDSQRENEAKGTQSFITRILFVTSLTLIEFD